MEKMIELNLTNTEGKESILSLDYDETSYSDLFAILVSFLTPQMIFVATVDSRPCLSTNPIDLTTAIWAFIEWHYANVNEKHLDEVIPICIYESETIEGALPYLHDMLDFCLFSDLIEEVD